MSSVTETHARVKSRVWQTIAQSDLDISDVNRPTVEKLVEIVTEAALLELDSSIDTSLAQTQRAASIVPDTNEDDVEEILWEGRPFLSMTLYYIVTDERIRIREGIFGKVHENIELVRVQDLDYSQTLSERMLNFGDVTIRSHDTNHPLIELKNIKDPEKVHETIRRAVLKARKRHHLSYREEM